MDYDEVNNCMTEQQKNSLKTAALQQLLQKVLGGAQEYTSYDDVNNQLTEQQKNSYQTAALQQLVEAGIGGGKQYTLMLDSLLLDEEEIIPLSSDIDGGGDTLAKLIGISVSDFLQYLEDVTSGERTDLPNLKVHVRDGGADTDTWTVGDVSIAYRYTGEDDPDTGDPISHFYLSFVAYSGMDSIYKYCQGEIKFDNNEWCIGTKEVPLGYPNIDNEEF